jgi:hypothetical protein
MPTQSLSFTRFLAGTVLAAASASICAFQKPTYGVDVHFAKSAVALSAKEREKLIQALDTVRNRDWCAFEAAYVSAYEDPREGPPDHVKKLARSRADYLANLLRAYGVPASLVGVETPVGQVYGGNQSPPPGTVQIEMVGGGVGPRPCRHPYSPGGFRVEQRR